MLNENFGGRHSNHIGSENENVECEFSWSESREPPKTNVLKISFGATIEQNRRIEANITSTINIFWIKGDKLAVLCDQQVLLRLN